MALGRNHPCWCGSGKKYKKCHLRRSSDQEPTRSEIFEGHRRPFRRPTCLYPDGDCGQPILAHTISRAVALSRIAEGGHVTGYDKDIGATWKAEGRPTLKPIGLKRASTFRGFCSVHDNALFADLDARPFDGSLTPAFLLLYRAIAREVYLKGAQAQAVQFQRTLDRGRPIDRQIPIQAHTSLVGAGVDRAIDDLAFHKAALDADLRGGEHGRIRAVHLHISTELPVVVASGFAPDFDFEGRKVQDFMRPEPLDFVAVSILPGDAGTIASLTWHASSDPAGMQLARSLLSDPHPPEALLRLAFCTSENIFLRPSWWDGLDQTRRDTIQPWLEYGLTPEWSFIPTILVDSGTRLLEPLEFQLASMGCDLTTR